MDPVCTPQPQYRTPCTLLLLSHNIHTGRSSETEALSVLCLSPSSSYSPSSACSWAFSSFLKLWYQESPLKTLKSHTDSEGAHSAALRHSPCYTINQGLAAEARECSCSSPLHHFMLIILWVIVAPIVHPVFPKKHIH